MRDPARTDAEYRARILATAEALVAAGVGWGSVTLAQLSRLTFAMDIRDTASHEAMGTTLLAWLAAHGCPER
jgi:hypothetical protein